VIAAGDGAGAGDGEDLKAAIAEWQESSRALRGAMAELFESLESIKDR